MVAAAVAMAASIAAAGASDSPCEYGEDCWHPVRLAFLHDCSVGGRATPVFAVKIVVHSVH